MRPGSPLLNNWETTYFDFDQSKLTKLFDGAAEMGVDLFLLDDGWFGNKYPRDNDKAGLGDWQENKKKLPDGIGYLVQAAAKKGLKFGIWLEPEMVNPKSELYEQHPDWILKLPNRPESYSRNQLVLDLVNPKVQDFVFHVVDDLLTRNPGLAYIKWDCNRPMTNAWSPSLKEHPSHLFIEYTRSLYKVLDRIRAKYPHLPMMLCSGGGGRTDYAALRYFTEFWPSDNTDGLERIFIQWGYSYFFPANTIAAHVTNSGKTSLKFRTDVAMMDKLGYDIKVGEMTPPEMQFTQEAIRTYKRLSETIWQGDLYRLVSPYEANRAVLQYVSGDKTKSVLFHYVLNVRRRDLFNRVRLEGLDAAASYRVTEVNLYPGTRSKNNWDGKVWSGYELMNTGLDLTAGGVSALTSQVYEITKAGTAYNPVRLTVVAPRVLLMNATRLEELKKKIANGEPGAKKLADQLQTEADKFLDMRPVSVMEKSSSPMSGTKHDYMSQAPYFWYDSSKPHGLPYLRRDGQRNPEIYTITDRRYLGELDNAVRVLSLGWWLAGDEKYAQKAAVLLRRWFLDDSTKMNPNLVYAQAVPGLNDGRGIGIIETIALTGIADAAGLLEGSSSWTKADAAALRHWYAQYLDWMLTSKNGKDEHAAKNNHGTWYLVQATDFALYSGNTAKARELAEEGKTLIEKQIQRDGKMPLELERTNGLGYSTYNLQAFFDLATLDRELGVDLWNYKNKEDAGIRTAFDWLLPYAAGKKKWDYQQISPYNKNDLHSLLLQAALAYQTGTYREEAAGLGQKEDVLAALLWED
jgi:hypothetical protein